MMDGLNVGDYIIYRNGDKNQLGRIKEIRENGCFVAYHEGETGALTPYSHIYRLDNEYTIEKTSLGGGFFNQ